MPPIDPTWIELFILAFIRIVTAMSLLPIFREMTIPSMVKVGLSALIALVIVPGMSPTVIPLSGTILDFLMQAGRETVCGLIIGFCGYLFFYAVDIAGQLVGYQAGFTMVSSFDSSSDAQSTIMAQFFHTLAILLFLSFNGHHLVIKALYESFQAIPIGQLSVDGRFMAFTTATLTTLLASGILMAAPILITLLVTDVGLGVLSRVAPAMNIFALGFALKVATALLVTAASLGMIATLFSEQAMHWLGTMPKLFEILRAP